MSRQALIIEFAADSVQAGLFSPSGTEPIAYASLPLAGKASVKEALQSMLASIKEKSSLDISSCRVFASIPPSSLGLRVVSVPVDKREKINEILPFELSGLLASETDNLVIDNIPLGEGAAMAITLDKKVLAEYLDAFRQFKIDPAWIGSALLSVPALLAEVNRSGGVKAFISRDFISVSEDGRPLFFNSFNGSAGLKLNLAYIDSVGLRIDRVYFTGLDGEDLKELTKCPSMEEIELASGLPPEAAGLFALAVVLKKDLLRETVNLRKGEFEYTKDKAVLKKRLKVTAGLALIIIGLVFGDIYLKYLVLDSEFLSYRNALRGAFLEMFPTEKGSMDELYQLSIKIKLLEKESGVVKGSASVLNVLKGLVKAASSDPAAQIRLREVTIADGKVKAAGEAASFEAANRFKGEVDKLFKNAQLSDLKAKAGGGAAFSLSVNLI